MYILINFRVDSDLHTDNIEMRNLYPVTMMLFLFLIFSQAEDTASLVPSKLFSYTPPRSTSQVVIQYICTYKSNSERLWPVPFLIVHFVRRASKKNNVHTLRHCPKLSLPTHPIDTLGHATIRTLYSI